MKFHNRFCTVAVFTLSLLLTTSVCFSAVEFQKNGYKIKIVGKQKGNRFKVSGDIYKGRYCKQLNISIFFSNSKDSGMAHVEAAIRDYSPKSGRRFTAEDTIYVSKQYKKYWHVDSIYTDCLQ